MIKKIKFFYLNYFNNLLEILTNFFFFFPYFFSTKTLLKTLFFPWKNLVYAKKPVNFSFSYLFEKISFNLISISIGFFMRICLLIFWIFLQIIYTLCIPVFFVFAILISPIFFIIQLFRKSPDELKLIEKQKFIKKRLLYPDNFDKVEEWFKNYYQELLKSRKWYSKENLFSYPPLARDWAFGFTYYLNQYSEELTSAEYLSSRPAVIDREEEIKQIEEILSKSRYNNVLIVGEEGVGKHSIIDALAYRIYHGETTSFLMYHRLIKLNMEKIVSSFKDQKKREMFFEELLEEAAMAKNIIIFIDKIDRYLSNEDSTRVDLSLPIEKYAKTSKLQIIGISTPFLYQKFIFPLEKINQIFSKVEVSEISQDLAEKILLKIAFKLEKKYQLTIPYETVKETIMKSSFYITHIPFPEKAINLLDIACNKARLRKLTLVQPDLINEIIAEKTKIPTQITPQFKEKLLNLNHYLKKAIFGQDLAMDKLSLAISRSFILLGKRKKPIASFLFLGPTGVGKTETAKVLSKIFFNSEKCLQRFDMALYQTTEDIEKLIGSQKTKDPGLLTKSIRENPYSVLLLDEIEKANANLINIFLTILDEGYFTDAFGNKVDCRNLVIIATSNAGSNIIFYDESKKIDDNYLINFLIEKKFFTPEFLNRFDAVLFYRPLTKDSFLAIAKKIIETIKKDLYQLYKINFEVNDDYLLNLINEKLDPRFGARNLERVIKENIEDKITQYILEEKIKEGETFFLK